MRRVALTVALLAAGGCGAKATPAECDALLDRYVELLVREHNPDLARGSLEAQI